MGSLIFLGAFSATASIFAAGLLACVDPDEVVTLSVLIGFYRFLAQYTVLKPLDLALCISFRINLSL